MCNSRLMQHFHHPVYHMVATSVPIPPHLLPAMLPKRPVLLFKASLTGGNYMYLCMYLYICMRYLCNLTSVKQPTPSFLDSKYGALWHCHCKSGEVLHSRLDSKYGTKWRKCLVKGNYLIAVIGYLQFSVTVSVYIEYLKFSNTSSHCIHRISGVFNSRQSVYRPVLWQKLLTG